MTGSCNRALSFSRRELFEDSEEKIAVQCFGTIFSLQNLQTDVYRLLCTTWPDNVACARSHVTGPMKRADLSTQSYIAVCYLI